MNTAAEIIEKSEQLMAAIKQSQFESVLSEISNWTQEEKVYRRMRGHFFGKIQLVQGNYQKAIQIFLDTIEAEGSHVLILAELVACYFMNKQYTSWKLAVEKLDSEIKIIGKKVHPINRYRVEIILAKSLELQGFLVEAYQKYLALYQKAPIQFKIKGLCNLVRLEAQYPISTDFSKYYLSLKQFVFTNEQPDYDPDILHSLLLAEAEHLDVEIAFKNLELIPKSFACFYALAFYELLDIWMRKDNQALEKLTKKLGDSVKPENIYQEKLLSISKNQFPLDWYTWSHVIPMAQYFRLIRFIYQKLEPKDQSLCAAQVNLLLKGLSATSRNLWLKFFKKDEVVLDIVSSTVALTWISEDCLQWNQAIIDFGKQQLLKKLVSILIEKRELLISEACLLLWDCEINESYTHRLRHLVHRINNLSKKEAFSNLLKINTQTIQLFTTT